MASFNTSGLDDIGMKIMQRSEKVAVAADAALNAGADVLVEAQRTEAQAMFNSDRSTGDLAASIKKGKVIETAFGRRIEVYPDGKDRHGVRNATKGFVQEYGRSGLTARPFITAANTKSEDAVNNAIREKWVEVTSG